MFYFFSAINRKFNPFRSLISAMPDEDLEGAPQDLPDLVSYIKQFHLKYPDSGPYKLQNPNIKDFSQNGQSLIIANLFNNMVSINSYNSKNNVISTFYIIF